jgi:hypothetical protein
MNFSGSRPLLKFSFLAATILFCGTVRIWSQESANRASASESTASVSDEDLRDRRDMGSPFVPLDSWAYPAFERLSALGYVNTALLGSKPWTRIECARLADEIEDAVRADASNTSEVLALLQRLHDEFGYELSQLGGGRNRSARVESVYSRVVSISGPALTDSYDFGQTISYDFGRPYQRGINGQVGGSASASVGPLAFFLRAEFQHAASALPFSDAQLAVISTRDLVPVSSIPQPPIGPTNRAQLLEGYASFTHDNWQIVAGRQSLSWSATPDGSMLWSNNAPPVTMLRIVNAEPLEPEGLLGFLGQVRVDQFVGRLDGHWYTSNPFVLGQKLTIKPASFLELGFGRTFLLGGAPDAAVTIGNVARGLFAVRAADGSVPGDGRSEFDWNLRVPGLHNYVVFYGDSFADDDGLPLQNPLRNPWRPGIYITRFPGLSKLDLHFDAVSTVQAGLPNQGLRDLNYWNQTYRDGYTNDGFLIGNSVGRYGKVQHGWLTYWFSPRNTLRLEYKHNSVSAEFIPGGGDWQDYSIHSDVYTKTGLYVKSGVQYERISNYPILFAGPQGNVAVTLEMGFMPGERRQN